MRTKLFYTGYNAGWKTAIRYATGTKVERQAIRVRLAKLNESYSQFAQGVYQGFTDLASQRAASIKSGLAPRTIRPGKLLSLLERLAA